jgi:opacity protein-like surface antigen
MYNKKIFFSAIILLSICGKIRAQDTTDLMSQLEREVGNNEKNQTNYTTAAFKTTRIINGHSIENVGKGVLDVKISHRFGKLNGGAYELFGLDNASMRMGFDYGLTPYLMVGIGRNTYEKTYDAFFKLKLLRQSTGRRKRPVTVSYVPTIAVKTIKFEDPNRKNFFTSRLFFTHQLLIGRKFSDKTSLQVMPTLSHRNLVDLNAEPNNLLAIGIGGRQKLTKRLSINAEYFYQLPGYKLTGTTDCFSLGFDIETGGHVFQIHFTNSQGMSERSFISETRGNWGKGDILFGFNISRVFTIGGKRK